MNQKIDVTDTLGLIFQTKIIFTNSNPDKCYEIRFSENNSTVTMYAVFCVGKLCLCSFWPRFGCQSCFVNKSNEKTGNQFLNWRHRSKLSFRQSMMC